MRKLDVNRARFPVLIKKMNSNNDNLKSIMNLLGLNFQEQVWRRLYGKNEFKVNEIITLCKYYNTNVEELFKEE